MRRAGHFPEHRNYVVTAGGRETRRPRTKPFLRNRDVGRMQASPSIQSLHDTNCYLRGLIMSQNNLTVPIVLLSYSTLSVITLLLLGAW